MKLLEIFLIIFIHWIGDFVVQTDEQSKGKSKSWDLLLRHTISYSIIWLNIGCLYFISMGNIWNGFIFAGITFICHTITDYFTSRLNAKLWAKGDVHNLFVSIGFDQVLHYVQLFLTFYLLAK